MAKVSVITKISRKPFISKKYIPATSVAKPVYAPKAIASRLSQEFRQFFMAVMAKIGRPKCKAERGRPIADGINAIIAMAKVGSGRLNPKEKST